MQLRRRQLITVLAAWGSGVGLGAGCSTLEPLPPSKGCSSDAECTVEGEACFNGQCALGNPPPRPIIGFDIQERTTTTTTQFRVQLRGCDRLVRARPNEPDVLLVNRNEVQQTFQFQVQANDMVAFDMLEPGDLLAAQLDVTQPGRLGRTPDPITRSIAHALDTAGGEPGSEVAPLLEWPRYHPLDLELPPPHVVWKTNPAAPLPPEGELAEVPLPPVYRMFRPPVVSTEADRACMSDADCCEGDACEATLNYCATSTGAPRPEGSTEAGQCTLIGNPGFIQTYVYEPACARSLTGNVKTFDVAALMPTDASVVGATVRVRYADVDPATPLTLFDSNNTPLAQRPSQCTTDEDCGYDDLACDLPTEQCTLRLAGRTANDSMAVSDDVGDFDARVYTYCEASPNEGNYPRAYTVTVSPPPGPRPTVTAEVLATFTPGTTGTQSPFDLERPLCIPEWGNQTEVELPLTGPSRALVVGGGDALQCCDVGCLPATADDFDPARVGPDSCDGRTSGGVAPSIRMETTFTLDDEQRAAWDLDCMPLVEGVAGRLSLSADCSDDTAACRVTTVAPGDADGPRPYTVRIESPVGSVLASRDLSLEVDAGGVPTLFDPVELDGRVLVRGTVTVDDETCALREDPTVCASGGAVVIAERLAMPETAERVAETPANTPGPYLHQTTTFFDPIAGQDGAYVLPLDPGGVYVITALPAANQDGGPAAYTIVDLREAKEATVDLVLEAGRLVTLDIDTFGARTTVVPLDLGSERSLAHPGRPNEALDLSRVGECLAPAIEPQACRIRQLTVPGASLPPSQVGIVRFRAREPRRDEDETCG